MFRVIECKTACLLLVQIIGSISDWHYILSHSCWQLLTSPKLSCPHAVSKQEKAEILYFLCCQILHNTMEKNIFQVPKKKFFLKFHGTIDLKLPKV